MSIHPPIRRKRPTGCRPALRVALVAAALAVTTAIGPALPVAHASGSSGTAPAGTAGSKSLPQLRADDGQFYAGSSPMTLRGTSLFNGWVPGWYPTIKSWGMNVVRFPFHWIEYEPEKPTHNGDGTWTHNFDGTYLDTLASDIALANQNGLYAVVAEYDADNQGFFKYPDWLYTSPYNSHGITYPQDQAGFDQAETDFWTDSLRQQFMIGMWRSVAQALSSVQGVSGYELLNEPQIGTLDAVHATTQAVLDFQLRVAAAVRGADPGRVIFITTRGVSGLGLDAADLTAFVALGNVAFDVHDYFGARWGTGRLENPKSPDRGEVPQTMTNAVSGDTQGPPYIGTTLGHERYLQSILDGLGASGLPLIVGEFGDQWLAPDVYNFLGNATSAMNALGLSWAANWGMIVVPDKSGLQPWATIILDAVSG